LCKAYSFVPIHTQHFTICSAVSPLALKTKESFPLFNSRQWTTLHALQPQFCAPARAAHQPLSCCHSGNARYTVAGANVSMRRGSIRVHTRLLQRPPIIGPHNGMPSQSHSNFPYVCWALALRPHVKRQVPLTWTAQPRIFHTCILPLEKATDSDIGATLELLLFRPSLRSSLPPRSADLGQTHLGPLSAPAQHHRLHSWRKPQTASTLHAASKSVQLRLQTSHMHPIPLSGGQLRLLSPLPFTPPACACTPSSTAPRPAASGRPAAGWPPRGAAARARPCSRPGSG
jgi:hypothetical protein